MTKVRSAFADLADAGQPAAILADLRALLPQSREVFGDTGFRQAAATVRIERHAAVTASALLRLQFRRLFDGIPTEFFEDRDRALAWLGWDASDPLLGE